MDPVERFLMFFGAMAAAYSVLFLLWLILRKPLEHLRRWIVEKKEPKEDPEA